jgi:hypothetical protein
MYVEVQVLECRRLLDSVAAASGKAGPRGYHSMLTLQLGTSNAADAAARQHNCLCFVELAAPDPKVHPAAQNIYSRMCCSVKPCLHVS